MQLNKKILRGNVFPKVSKVHSKEISVSNFLKIIKSFSHNFCTNRWHWFPTGFQLHVKMNSSSIHKHSLPLSWFWCFSLTMELLGPSWSNFQSRSFCSVHCRTQRLQFCVWTVKQSQSVQPSKNGLAKRTNVSDILTHALLFLNEWKI